MKKIPTKNNKQIYRLIVKQPIRVKTKVKLELLDQEKREREMGQGEREINASMNPQTHKYIVVSMNFIYMVPLGAQT